MIEHVERPGSRFRDHLDPKVADWIKPYTDNVSFNAAILGAPLSKTSISHSAASRLPDSIRGLFHSFSPYNVNHRLDLSEVLKVIDVGNVQMHLTDLSLCQQRIEDAVASYWKAHSAPLALLGGDHSITGAAIQGLAKATKKRYGIVHFDAHHDVRNLEDGGRSNGTPFRTLFSEGAVLGKNVCQIGIRDYVNAKAYHEYVLEQGVTVVTARQVFQKGLGAVVEEALAIASDGTDAIYVSFDMDVFDQSFVPGVPAPSPGGLTIWDAIDAVEWLGSQKQVEMFDVVCADPSVDVRDLTSRVAAYLVMSFFTGLALRA